MTLSSKTKPILAVAAFALMASGAAFATSAEKTTIITPGKTTTTVETTTATSYTVSSRKVGTKGGRLYKPQEVELEGGVRRDITVDGVPVETEVLVVDEIAPIKDAVTEGDYYTNKRDAIKTFDHSANIHVHNTGRLNR